MFAHIILAAHVAATVSPSTAPGTRKERAATPIALMSIRMERLARVRLPVAVAAAAGCLACRDTSVASSPPLDRVVAIAVIPPVVSVGPGETQAFTAGDVTAGGDTVPGAVVEWHATGGTITSAGVYTAGSDPGTFSVTATRLGGGVLPGRAGISVIHRVVAVIRIQPDTATLPLQGSWQLFATAFDSAGHPLSSARITWASDAPAVGAVDSNGVVTGLTAGTATITAASQGQTASAVISVVPPGSGPWPNEPQAFTIVSDNPFNLLNAPGWQLVDNTQNLVTLALDPQARLSPPSVLQYSFPVGFPGGIGPGAEALELVRAPSTAAVSRSAIRVAGAERDTNPGDPGRVAPHRVATCAQHDDEPAERHRAVVARRPVDRGLRERPVPGCSDGGLQSQRHLGWRGLRQE